MANPSPPVFFPGKSEGQRSLAGYNPYRVAKSDPTERVSTAQRKFKIRKRAWIICTHCTVLYGRLEPLGVWYLRGVLKSVLCR